MAGERPIQILLKDPLSEVARKERRNLLAVAAAGVVIGKTGMVPTKISALGIEFSQADRAALVRVLAAVISYFLVAFVLYAASDFTAWRARYHESQFEAWFDRLPTMEERDGGVHVAPAEGMIRARERRRFYEKRRPFYAYLARPVPVLRASFDFGLPILIGIYAFVTLIRTPA